MSVITNGNNSRILQPYDRRHASGAVSETPLHADSLEHVPRIHHALKYFVIFFYLVFKILCWFIYHYGGRITKMYHES